MHGPRESDEIVADHAAECAAANPAIALLVESARSRCCLSGLQSTRPAGRVAELGSLGASMRFEQKLASALALLETTGIWRSNYAPPLCRFLWRVGGRVPPPHFVGFTTNFLFTGSFFGLTWGLLVWFALWSRSGMSPGLAVGAAIVAGLLFGLSMAGYYRYGAHKHRIPLWRDFQPRDDDAS